MLEQKLCVLLKLSPTQPLVRLGNHAVLDNGFGQPLRGNELLSRGLCVLLEVVAGAVGTRCALNPSVRRLELEVPAVARVVRHLVAEVLAKPQPAVQQAKGEEENEEAEEEAEGGGGNKNNKNSNNTNKKKNNNDTNKSKNKELGLGNATHFSGFAPMRVTKRKMRPR